MNIKTSDFLNFTTYIKKIIKYRLWHKLISSFLMLVYFCINLPVINFFMKMLDEAYKPEMINLLFCKLHIANILPNNKYLLGSIGIFCCIILSFICKLLSDWIMNRTICDTSKQLQLNFFQLLQDASVNFYIKYSPNGLHDVINRHILAMENLLHAIFLEVIPGGIFLVISIFIFEIKLAIILILFVILYFVVVLLIYPKLNSVVKVQNLASLRKTTNLVEMINMSLITKILNTDFFTFNRVKNYLSEEISCRFITFFFQKSISSLMYSVGMMVLSPLSLFMVVNMDQRYFVYHNFVKTVILFGTRVAVVGTIANAMSDITQCIGIMRNIEIDNAIGKYHIDSIDSIEVRNLSYSRGTNKIISNLSLKIHKKEKILIMGSSGIGKSTLLEILIKTITVANDKVFFNGICINDLSKKNIYNLIGYVMQEMKMIGDTLRNNITLGQVADDNQIKKALNDVGLGNTFSEKDFNKKIDIFKSNLSGGQQRRICVSRFFIKKNDVLFLDEITTGLDSRTSLQILQFILKKQSIIIAVSHDISWNKYFDRILLIKENGEYEIGTHDQLYDRSAYYRSFFDIESIMS